MENHAIECEILREHPEMQETWPRYLMRAIMVMKEGNYFSQQIQRLGDKPSLEQSLNQKYVDTVFKFMPSSLKNVISKGQARKVLAILQANDLLYYSIQDTKREGEQFKLVKLPHAVHKMFLKGSLINHSCYPNSTLVSGGRYMMLMLDRSIAKGEEITYDYLQNSDELGYETRQKLLMDRWQFKCNCERCVAEAKILEKNKASKK